MKKIFYFGLAAIAALSITSCGSKAVLPADMEIDMTLDTRGTEITFWTSFGEKISGDLVNLLKKFEEKTQIKVTHEAKGGYEGLRQAMNLSAPSGTYADVAIGYPDHFAGYINQGIQGRLDYIIAHDKDTPTVREDGFEEIAPVDMDTYFPDYMNENRNIEFDSEGNGYTVGIPFNKSTEVMVYNKTFIDWAHEKNAKIVVPQTYDELKSVGLEIYKLLNDAPRTGTTDKNAQFTGKGLLPGADDKNGYALGTDGKVYFNENKCKEATKKPAVLDLTSVNSTSPFKIFSYDSQANFFISLTRNYGGSYTEVDKNGEGYVTFNNDKTIEALEMVKDLSDSNILGIPLTWDEKQYTTNAFILEKCLFSISSSAGASKNVSVGNRFETGVAPVLVKDLENKNVISQGTNLAIFLKSDPKKALASWKLIKFLTQEANGEFAYLSGYYPCSTTGLNSDIYQDFLNMSDAELSVSERASKAAANVNANTYLVEENGWNKFVDNAFVGSSLVRNEADTIIPRVIEGTDSIEKILDDAYDNLASYVRD